MDDIAEYEVILTDRARQLLTKIKDIREQELLIKRLEKLKEEPEKLWNCFIKRVERRSHFQIGQRYRIVY